ncbi:LysR family transcriptional regulator [Clostridium sartagoforme]|uniref:LysR family transcriptional regulator n=1 Tax=Clostridium sartagoforme TaxID=84031 RepID=A0A4S2DJ59_9CLOT|nr:LysR family transcriptional regulator [Clostridium sartagoforme]TGY41642.1 LysR family transcriptional regulator [Clostridium sartagoforme]
MNLNHLNYFRVLAKLEHYTQAADKLSITQPSLSHAMSSLEKDLGTYLFEKQGRNIKLTKYGKIYFEYVDRALSELEKGERKLRELTNISSGTIELGYIYTLGPTFVPMLIKKFVTVEENKDIKFVFGQGTTKVLIEELKNEKYDMVLCSYVENEDEVDFIPIENEELVVIVSNEHPLAKKESIDLIDLDNYPFIGFSEKSGIRPLINKLFEKIDLKPNIICEVEEDNAVAGLVEINYGIAVVPRISSLKNYNIKILPIIKPTHERFIYLATLKNRYLTPSANLFKNFITENSKDKFSDIKK